MNCIFCTNANSAGEVVYEDPLCWVMLHPDWSPRGHAMIVVKTHVENACALREEEWLHVARIWHRAERVLLEETKMDRAILLKLGLMTPHLHVHVYPLSNAATRLDVFEAIDGNRGEVRDDAFVTSVRQAMQKRSLT
jgi:diadenosine tetraphosphate (Ap4A) HIT family hydrolase